MTYVITDPCLDTKDTACVDVCPVDCIHPTKEDPDHDERLMLFIDPETCIDCDACEPVCPVKAIYPDTEVPEDQAGFIEWNALHYQDPDEAHLRVQAHQEECGHCRDLDPAERREAHS